MSVPATATVNATGVVTGVATGTTNITYTETDANGCSTTSAPFAVTVTKPVANNITGSANVCITSTAALSSHATGTGALSYNMALSVPATATVNATGVVTGVATGTTNITNTVTDANGCSTTSAPFAVTVTKPVANKITGSANVCMTSTAALSSHATGTGALSYTWASSVPATATVNATGVITGVATGTTNITYTVTDANGCSTTSADFQVTINPLANPSLSGADLICPGD